MYKRIKTSLYIGISLLMASTAAGAQDVISTKGAGSTAAEPLFNLWSHAYAKVTGKKIHYNANGSSNGIEVLKDGNADFAITDIALPHENLIKDRLIQMPIAVSGVVPIFNLPGVKNAGLKLNSDLLAKIFTRQIKSWNSPQISVLNPGVSLPNQSIIVIAREDKSGTTYNFSGYLSNSNAEWATSMGTDYALKWDSEVIKVKGSRSVASLIKKTPYSISYIDFTFAVQEKLAFAALLNRSGKYVTPSSDTFTSSINSSQWVSTKKFNDSILNVKGDNSWPITYASFVVFKKEVVNVEPTIEALKFFTWDLMYGDRSLASVELTPLPTFLQAKAFRDMMMITTKEGNALQWSPVLSAKSISLANVGDGNGSSKAN